MTTLLLNRPPRHHVRTLGWGERIVLWTDGCSIGRTAPCPSCVSPETWAGTNGVAVPVAELAEQLRARAEVHDGLTISGGEPSDQEESLVALLEAFGAVPDHWEILLYSGHRLATLRRRHRRLLARVDVVVDGRFDPAKVTPTLPWRGSANQHLTVVSDRAIAWARYGDAHLSRPHPAPQLHLERGAAGVAVELIGIPRPDGELTTFEAAMARQGLNLELPGGRR